MIRCPHEIERCQTESKSGEFTRDEQMECLPITSDELMQDLGASLNRLTRPETLSRLFAPYTSRISASELTRFVGAMEEQYGTAFCRRAGLPVGRAKLSLAS